MFKSKKTKVQPQVDAHIIRRYEDLAICIHQDIKNGQGLHNFYAPWLEVMLERLPQHVREEHSLLVKPLTQTSTGAELSTTDAKNCVAGPNRLTSAFVSKQRPPEVGNGAKYQDENKPILTTESSDVAVNSGMVETDCLEGEDDTGVQVVEPDRNQVKIIAVHNHTSRTAEIRSKFCIIL